MTRLVHLVTWLCCMSKGVEMSCLQTSNTKLLSDLAVLHEVRGRCELFRTPNTKVRCIVSSHVEDMHRRFIFYNSHGQNGHTTQLQFITHLARVGITQL